MPASRRGQHRATDRDGISNHARAEGNCRAAITALVQPLIDRFPTLGNDTISGIVSEVHRGFDGRPVRDLVPLLVEREALRQLSATGRDGRSSCPRGPWPSRRDIAPKTAGHRETYDDRPFSSGFNHDQPEPPHGL
ncbi:three-helix bundle dimerization domain-containing protein [Nocardia sp. NPDC004722]